MLRFSVLVSPLLLLVLPFTALAGWGHHHRHQYYQAAPVYAAPMYYAPQPSAAGPSASLADLLLPILLDRLRDNLGSNPGNNEDDYDDPSPEPVADGSIRADLQQLRAELAEFRKAQAGANESLGIMVQRQGQELATVRADLEAMKTKLDAITAATGSGSTLQDTIANMSKRFPQRSKAEIRTTLLDELNKKIKAQSKLTAAEQLTLIDALTKDFDAQLDAAFPSWKE